MVSPLTGDEKPSNNFSLCQLVEHLLDGRGHGRETCRVRRAGFVRLRRRGLSLEHQESSAAPTRLGRVRLALAPVGTPSRGPADPTEGRRLLLQTWRGATFSLHPSCCARIRPLQGSERGVRGAGARRIVSPRIPSRRPRASERSSRSASNHQARRAGSRGGAPLLPARWPGAILRICPSEEQSTAPAWVFP